MRKIVLLFMSAAICLALPASASAAAAPGCESSFFDRWAAAERAAEPVLATSGKSRLGKNPGALAESHIRAILRAVHLCAGDDVGFSDSPVVVRGPKPAGQEVNDPRIIAPAPTRIGGHKRGRLAKTNVGGCTLTAYGVSYHTGEWVSAYSLGNCNGVSGVSSVNLVACIERYNPNDGVYAKFTPCASGWIYGSYAFTVDTHWAHCVDPWSYRNWSRMAVTKSGSSYQGVDTSLFVASPNNICQ